MNIFLAIFVVSMAVMVTVDGADIHLCQALMDNNWRISYAINLPGDQSSKKYIVVKKHYWEIVDNGAPPPGAAGAATTAASQTTSAQVRRRRQDPSADSNPPAGGPHSASQPSADSSAGHSGGHSGGSATNGSKAKSPIQLVNIMGKESDWLDENSGVGFGVRYETADVAWTKDTIGTLSNDLTSIKWGSVLLTAPALDVKESNSFKVTFTDFKPSMAFPSYSTAEPNSFIFMEQTTKGSQWSARFQEYTMSPNTNNWIRNKDVMIKKLQNDTSDPMSMLSGTGGVVPAALVALADAYHIKGTFNTAILHSKDIVRKATIVLIEQCIQSASLYPCPGNVSYVVCTTLDDDPYTMDTRCKLDNLQPLFDCSKWHPEVPTTAGAPTGAAAVANRNDDTHSNTTQGSAKAKTDDDGKGGGHTWIWILLIIIIIIIIIVIICLFFFCGSKKQEEQPAPAPKSAKSATGPKSQTGGASGSKAGPKSSIGGKSSSTISTRSTKV